MDAVIHRIALPALFSFEECLWFLNRNYDDCLHFLETGKVTKAIRLQNEEVVISLSATERDVEITIHRDNISPDVLTAVITYIEHWLDIRKDLTPFYALLGKHKQLAYMRENFWGLRAIGIPDLFEALVWSITGQQINLKFAYTLKRRLTETYGTTLRFNDRPFYIFPEPHVLAQLEPEDLRKMQFSSGKADYIINTAKAFVNGAISKEQLLLLPDFESRQKALTQFKGIGIWTANYVLMKTIKDAGAIPTGDVGLLNALVGHGIIQNRTETQKIEKLFKQFKGWESYLVIYLWRSLAHPKSA